jgi:hypothetical protein
MCGSGYSLRGMTKRGRVDMDNGKGSRGRRGQRRRKRRKANQNRATRQQALESGIRTRFVCVLGEEGDSREDVEICPVETKSGNGQSDSADKAEKKRQNGCKLARSVRTVEVTVPVDDDASIAVREAFAEKRSGSQASVGATKDDDVLEVGRGGVGR